MDVCRSDPQTYRSEEVWLTLIQVDEVQVPVYAALQSREVDLLEFLRSKKCQYSAGLMTAVSLAPEKLDAVSVNSVLEHCVEEHFVMASFVLVVVDGPHRLLCIRELTMSKQAGTGYILQLTRMAVIRASEFEVLTGHEHITLISSTKLLSELVFQQIMVSVIIRSLVQYHKTFRSIYDSVFQKVRVPDIGRGLLSFCFICGAIEWSYFHYSRVTKVVHRSSKAL